MEAPAQKQDIPPTLDQMLDFRNAKCQTCWGKGGVYQTVNYVRGRQMPVSKEDKPIRVVCGCARKKYQWALSLGAPAVVQALEDVSSEGATEPV